MAQVDPDDDTIRRFVVWHYRFDPLRNERRNVVVAAYDDDREFQLAVHRLSQQLARRKQDGAAEDVERISGTVLDRGSRAATQAARRAWRAARARPHSPADDR